jgi:heat shock protein HtpX
VTGAQAPALPRAGGAAARNLLKCTLLVALFAGAWGALGWLVAGTQGATVFAVCSLLASMGAYTLGDRALLGMLGARPAAVARDPLLRSAADRIAASVGVAAPKLSVIEDGFPRAFAVGRGPRSATLVLSRGALQGLPAAELDALIAHELWHVRTRDVLTQTLAVLLASTLVETSRIGGWFSRALLYVLGPLAAAFTHALLSPKREFAADAAAAAIAGWERAADALLRLDRAADLVQFRANPATEPLYTVSPFDTADRLTRMFVTHPPLQRRLDALRVVGAPDESASSRPAV